MRARTGAGLDDWLAWLDGIQRKLRAETAAACVARMDTLRMSTDPDEKPSVRRAIDITGTVPGFGFRPHMCRLAGAAETRTCLLRISGLSSSE
jgi:hypothetical protein